MPAGATHATIHSSEHRLSLVGTRCLLTIACFVTPRQLAAATACALLQRALVQSFHALQGVACFLSAASRRAIVMQVNDDMDMLLKQQSMDLQDTY